MGTKSQTFKALVLALALSPTVACALEKLPFDLPASSANVALREYAKQAQRQVLFPHDLLKEYRSNPVSGNYDADEALSLLLANTGLEAVVDPTGVLVIRIAHTQVQEEGVAMTKTKKGFLASLISIFSAAGATIANADDAPKPRAGDIEEMVVTAQKREQALDDVPMAISAVSGAEVENMGAIDLAAIQASIPSLTVTKTGETETVTIRSVAPPGSTLPTVGRYVDEISLNAEFIAFGIDFPLVDINRVEVLKGPQGTLYGEGSIGGTVRYIPQGPTFGETDGVAEVSLRSVSHGGMGYRGYVAGNLPIDSDTFGMRAVVSYEQTPGWIKNDFTGKDSNEDERKFIRLKALWEPNDRFSAEMLYQHMDAEYNTPYTNPGFVPDYFQLEPTDTDYDIFGLTLNFDFGWAELVSATSYYDRDINSYSDVSGSIAFIDLSLPGFSSLVSNIPYNVVTNNESFTQEFRLTGDVNEKLFWTAGIYYKDSEQGGPITTSYYPNPVVDYFGLLTLPEYLEGTLFSSTESKAAFFELNYLFTDQFEMTFGFRKYKDKREAVNDVYSFGAPLGIDTNLDNDSDVMRLVAKYRFTDDLMVYLSASEGFRSGGAQFFEYPGFPVTFKPEQLTTYEIGAKGSLSDGLIDYELALYQTDYEDIQVYLPNPLGLQFFDNVGKAEMKGVELATNINVSEQLFFRFSGGYTSSEYKEPGLTHDVGDPVDGTPKFTFSVSGDYRFDWSSNVGGHLRADYFFEDGKPNSVKGFGYAEELILTQQNRSFNLRLGADFGGQSIYLFAENLFDYEAATSKPIAALNHYTFQQPRTIGITYRTSF